MPLSPNGAQAAPDHAPDQPKPADTRPQTHLGPVQDETTRRERFDPQELAIVVSHYDIGVIESIKDYPRGSRRAPKVRITTRDGEFLLKRRAPGRDDPYRVAFAHRLQLTLAEHDYPLAHLIGTRDDNNSLVQHNGRVYEMFEYVRGLFFSGLEPRCAILPATHWRGSTGSWAATKLCSTRPKGHTTSAPGIHMHIAAIPDAVTTVDVEADEAALVQTCAFLKTAYDHAVDKVNALGYMRWKRSIVHGDWHPGNLLFNDNLTVKAVIDFDLGTAGAKDRRHCQRGVAVFDADRPGCDRPRQLAGGVGDRADPSVSPRV